MNTKTNGKTTSLATRPGEAFALSATFAARAQTLPGEAVVSSQQDLVDPEFGRARGEIAWVDDQRALGVVGNGPEWLATVLGPRR